MTRFLPSCMFPLNYLLSTGVTRDCGRQVALLSDRAPPGAVRFVAVCQNELAIVKRVRAFLEAKVARDHQVLGGGCFPIRAAAGGSRVLGN